MVQRMSQELNIALPSQGSVAVPGQGATENVLDKFKTAAPLVNNGAAVVQSLFSNVEKLGGQAWQASTEEAYVQGAAQVGVAESEAELQADSMTRDWAVAGFRDTQGKLLQAKQEANFLTNLPKLQAMAAEDPGGLNDFLAAQRANYAETYNGMSRQARESSIAKRITYEQQAIAQYTKARKAYVYGLESKALQATFSPAVGRLEAALESGDPKAISTARDSVATVFAGDVWTNPRLTDDDRVALTGELLDRLFVTSDTGTYNRLDAMGVLSKLPAEMQTKYAEKYRSNLQQNDARRFAEYHDTLATVLANSADPNSENFPDHATFSQIIDKGILIGAIKGNAGMEYKRDYLAKLSKRQDQHGLGIAYSTGNQDFIFSRGKTVKDAVDAYESARFAEGRTTEQVAAAHITIGATKGWAEAYQRAGTLLTPAFSSLLTTDQPPAPMLQQVKSLFTAMDTLEDSGKTVDFAQVLAGVPENMRGDVLALRGRMKANESPETALAAVKEQRARAAQLAPSMRAGLAAAQGKTTAKLVNELKVGGVFNEAVKGLRSFVGMDTTERAMRPYVAPFADETTAQRYLYNMQQSLETHLSKAIDSNPYLQGDELKQVAMAGMANSLIDTRVGPVMLPYGADLHKFLNLPPVANKGNVAAVIEKIAAPTVEGATTVANFESGALTVREFKDGAQVAQRRVAPAAIGDGVRQLFEQDAKRVDRLSGRGVVRKDLASQGTVRFNGRNTAAIDDGLMFKFRENLVTNEGVKGEAYGDLSNRTTGRNLLTVGVGITSTNDYFPKDIVKRAGDKVPQEVIDATFRDASNAAAKQGLAVASQYGLDTNKWFLLAAELAYQSGPGTLQKDKSYREMFDAASSGNYTVTLEAFRRSPAYQMSGKLRRDHYEKLITKAMKG